MDNLNAALHDLDRIRAGELEGTLVEFMHIIDAINETNGWNTDKSEAEWAALAHTEISEAFEEYRNGHHPKIVYYTDNNHGVMKPEGMSVEYADVLIRVLHWFARHQIDPVSVMVNKLRYNATRGYRHGGKVV